MVAGNIGSLGVAVQATKGTAAAAPAHRYTLTGGGLGPNPEVSDLEESSATRLRVGSYMARTRAAGTPAAYARPNMLGILLYGAMGGKAVTGAADPYTPTFTLATVQPYLTFWRDLGDILFERFVDCKLSSLVLRSVEGQALIVEHGVVGLGAQSQTAIEASPALDAGDPFVHYDAQGQLLVEGVAVSSIRSVIVTINTGAAAIPGDSLSGYAVSEGMLEITIETVQLIENAGLWNRLHYGTAAPADDAIQTRGVLELGGSPAGLDLKWTKRDNAGVAAAPARELEILAPRVQVRSIGGFDVNTNGEPLTATVTYRVYRPAAGNGLTAILKNSTTAITPS
jgi:hypothetical protein